MKKEIFFLFLILPTILLGQDCKELQSKYAKQLELNKILLEEVELLGVNLLDRDITVNSFSKDIVVNVLRCEGDTKKQSVTLYFNVVNPKLPNQAFYLNGSTYSNGATTYTQAYDEIGNAFIALTAKLGTEGLKYASNFKNGALNINLTTGYNPVVGSVTFANILPTVSVLRKVDIGMNHYNLVGSASQSENRGVTEIFNIPIDWK